MLGEWPTSSLIVPSRSTSTNRRTATRAVVVIDATAPSGGHLAAHARGIDLERGELPAHPLEGRAHGRPCTGGRRDQQVPASAGTADLAPGRASACGRIQHRLDRRVLRDIGVHALLRLEGLAQHRPEPVHVTALDRVAHRVGHLAELLHAEQGLLASGLEQLDLTVDQPDVAAHLPGVAEQDVLSELLGGIGPDVQRGDVGAVARELDQVAAPRTPRRSDPASHR